MEHGIVKFAGGQIPTTKNGKVFVAVKEACNEIGLPWKSVHKLIQRDRVLSEGVSIMEIPSRGGPQKTLHLPLREFFGLLIKINPERVKNPEVRGRLILWQRESCQAIEDYWTKGAAINPRFFYSIARARQETIPTRHIIQAGAQESLCGAISLPGAKVGAVGLDSDHAIDRSNCPECQRAVYRLESPIKLPKLNGGRRTINLTRMVRHIENGLTDTQVGSQMGFTSSGIGQAKNRLQALAYRLLAAEVRREDA